jgi:hypothetical protein
MATMNPPGAMNWIGYELVPLATIVGEWRWIGKAAGAAKRAEEFNAKHAATTAIGFRSSIGRSATRTAGAHCEENIGVSVHRPKVASRAATE